MKCFNYPICFGMIKYGKNLFNIFIFKKNIIGFLFLNLVWNTLLYQKFKINIFIFIIIVFMDLSGNIWNEIILVFPLFSSLCIFLNLFFFLELIIFWTKMILNHKFFWRYTIVIYFILIIFNLIFYCNIKFFVF